jgi:hypothetical protein
MSCLVMRPEAPVPATVVRSTLFSEAILRTSGEERNGSPLEAEAAGAGVASEGTSASSLVWGDADCGAAGAADLVAPAAPPITATMAPTLTVWPSCTLISVSVPAMGEGISASTLSVEISKMGSSRETVSPTFLSHFVSVPSVMDSPI